MTKPTYEELELEVARLRDKLSGGADDDFTKQVSAKLPPHSWLFDCGHILGGKIVARPSELWQYMFPSEEPSTRNLAKLGRSLQALGWARSAKRGNLIFTLPENEYAR